MDVGVPRSLADVVPDALQVGGKVNAARTADFKVASVGEIERFEHAGVSTVTLVVTVDEGVGRDIIGGAFEVEVNAVEERLIVGHMGFLQGVETGFNGVVDACLNARGELGGVADIGFRSGVEIGAACENNEYFVGILDGDAFIGGGHLATRRNDLDAGVIAHRGKLACKIGFAVGIFCRGAQSWFAWIEGEAEAELSLLVGRIACHNDTSGVGREIFTGVGHFLVWTLERHLASGGGEVNLAVVVLCGTSRTIVERAADVFGKYGTEVFVIAVASTIVGVAATPKGLFVKLDFVFGKAAEEAGTKLAVADWQAVFHPNVADTGQRGWFVIPKGELVLWHIARDANGLEVGIDHIVGRNEEQRVVVVCRVPNADAIAKGCATPLVEGFSALSDGLDFP